MFAILLCSCAAAARTASLIAGLTRRLSVDTLVRDMLASVPHIRRKCNAQSGAVACEGWLRRGTCDTMSAVTSGERRPGRKRGERMTSIIFGISLFIGVAAVVLVAFTLLWIVLGKLDV